MTISKLDVILSTEHRGGQRHELAALVSAAGLAYVEVHQGTDVFVGRRSTRMPRRTEPRGAGTKAVKP